MAFTIFAVPKGFDDPHIAMIQNNAIQSWTLLEPRPEVILLGDECGVAEAADRFGCLHIVDIMISEWGTFLVDDLFARAQEVALNEIVAYVNADIVLFQDFAVAVERVSSQFCRSYLMVGVRWDWNMPVKIDFLGDWAMRVRELARQQGHRHNDYGIDYFVFRKGSLDYMLPFIVGYYAWDNFLVQDSLRRNVPLIDASWDVFIIHQNHPERLKDRGLPGEDPQRLWNLCLAGGLEKLREDGGGNVSRAPWVLRDGRIKRRR